jgi:hypothetical protein
MSERVLLRGKMTKEIELTQGKITLVDDEDYEYLSQWKWSYLTSGYARRKQNNKCVLLHRFIMNVPDDMLIDHINMNTLDNRKSNLRICTKSQNMANRDKISTNNGKYKGIYLYRGKWRAEIKHIKKIHIGTYDNPEDAARAYDKEAKKIFGVFARPNFKD